MRIEGVSAVGRNQGLSNLFRDQQGVTMILVAIVMLVIIGFAALAIDIGHLFVVRNELKNAADAGALAGARVLLNADGTVNTGADAVAMAAATANKSEKQAVEVTLAADVKRGHWSFATEQFTPNNSTAAIPLWDVSTAELDANPDFINAIWVQTWRQQTPALSFFARILGFFGFVVRDEAVGYVGFAGTLEPEAVDQPIAICLQSILDPNTGAYTCNTGRMIDSGGGTTHNTGAWTNFEQPCSTASVPTVRPLVCGDGNPLGIDLGEGMGTTGGMQDNVYRDLRDCWLHFTTNRDSRGYPMEFWPLTLPVIDCPGNNPGPCSEARGAVTLNVIWIKDTGTDSHWMDIPLQMEDWTCDQGTDISSLTEVQRHQCWRDFTDHFNLRTSDGTSAGDLTPTQLQKTMFFQPDCTPHIPIGRTGGLFILSHLLKSGND